MSAYDDRPWTLWYPPGLGRDRLRSLTPLEHQCLVAHRDVCQTQISGVVDTRLSRSVWAVRRPVRWAADSVYGTRRRERGTSDAQSILAATLIGGFPR